MQPVAPTVPRRVMVVDDNRDLADNIAELLEDAGFQTRTAASVEDGAALATEQACDLAIVDIRLPGGSGVDLAGTIKRHCPEAEVILMTANASIDTAVAAVREGVFSYIQKPFDPAQLLALAERAWSQVALRRERTTLAKELARSETLHRGVVDAVESFIVGLDTQARVRMWNRSAASSTGFAAADVLGHPFADWLASDSSRQRLAEAMQRAGSGEAVTGLELPLRTLEGEQRIVRWTLTPFPSAAPDEPHVLAVGTDLTRRLDLERRAAEAEAMASIATLTAGLAHEIRNPLNAASLQLELLSRSARRVLDPELRERLESRSRVVREELERLTRLLGDFLSLAKPKAIALEPVDLRQLVREVIALQEPAATAATVALRERYAEGPLLARGSAPMLKQVLVNLIVNAVDALGPRGGGEVTLSCHPTSEARIELSVDDDGPGIAAEVAGRLFEPFVTSKEAGTGLGLTIVKRIVDRHGGTIHVSSMPGAGTSVRVTLERALAPASPG